MNNIRQTTIEYISDSGNVHIVVICGGMSEERAVSILSSISVIDSLVKQGYRVTKMDMGYDIANSLAKIKPDIVFNCLHGTYGEDGALPGLLNIMRIPYTNSGLSASAISFNKEYSQKIFRYHGLRVPEHVIISNKNLNSAKIIKDPYVIKPLTQGSSIGIEIIFPEDRYHIADYQFQYGDKVMVEQYIKGKEIQVAVLDGKALGTLEIKLLKRRFYDYDTKYKNGYAEHLYPGRMNEKQIKEVKLLAEKANMVVGASGITRVEFILSERDNQFYLLEINTHPGFTELSICPEIAKYNDITFDQLVHMLLATAKYES